MSIARAYADKDTWITEASVTSNFGETPILEVWNNINEVTQRKEYARILIRFSLSSLSAQSCLCPIITTSRTGYSSNAN